MATKRSYGGVSAEQRSARRRAALLSAGFDIVGTHGAGRLTVAALCTRADLNERYYYESFTSTDEVLVAVFDQVIEEVAAAIVLAVAAAPDVPRAKARAAIGAAVELLADDPRRSRIVFVEPLSAPALNSRRADVGRNFVALILGQAEEFYGPDVVSRAGAAGVRADFSAAYLLGGLAEVLTAWLRGDLKMTREELIERATDVFVLVGEHAVEPTRPAPPRPRKQR
jgi:AcrR family transcriptional regulator